MESYLPTEGIFDVIVSDTLLAESETTNRNDSNLIILKYNKQATGTTKNGTLSCNDKTGDALLTWSDNEATGLQFTGKRIDARATECLLVFDPDTNSFTLEHQPQIYQFSSAATTVTRSSANSYSSNAGYIEESKTNNTTLLLPTSQSNATATKSSVDNVDLLKKTVKAAQAVAANQKTKPTSPSAPSEDFEDVFIEIDSTLSSSSSMTRNTTGSINQKPAIYAPVTVNASNIFSSTNTTSTTADIYSATSSDDNDDDASGTSSDSGSSSSSSSGSSSGSDDSDSSTDSDEEETSNDRLNKVDTIPTKLPPPIPSPIDDNDEMNIDDLDSAIAAAMEGVEEKERDNSVGHSDDDDDDNYDWLQNEIEAEIS